MRVFGVFFVFLIFGLFGGFCEKNSSVFVATNDWQTVKKGQAIPKGLHVRHNFQTGVTEAKLMEKDESQEEIDDKKNSLSLHSDAVLHDITNDLVLSIDELKARLKKIKIQPGEEADSAEHQEEVKKTFKTYDEIKEDFKALEMNITTDSEILSDIFEKFSAYNKALTSGSLLRSEVDGISQIFGELEFLLHQIDNAQLFADLGGMEKIISPCLNITNDEVKIEALMILGTAVQSNPKVQLKALNNDLVQKLLHTLTTSTKVSLQSRCMFALSALVRQFPGAQKVLIDHGGLEIFGKILEDGNVQVQLRVMKLITDLAVERQNIKDTEDEALRLRKIREYEKTGFEEKLLLHNYCKYLSNLIIKHYKDVASGDFLQVVLENMITLSSTCGNEFRDADNVLLRTINELISIYGDKTEPEEVAELILRLRTLVFGEKSHDEL